MSTESLLPTGDFYRAVASYMSEADPTLEDERWRASLPNERAALGTALGAADGRTILDCSCGTGGQAIPLAQLGWRVTATDLVAEALSTAAARAEREGVTIAFRPGDLRDRASLGSAEFDAVISCMALDNLADDAEIALALRNLFAVLQPGGRCYLRLRDFDHLLAMRPRYEVREERRIAHGRVIRLEDWTFEGESHAICTYIFLREDERQVGYRWQSTVFAYRRRALRKAELAAHLRDAGFAPLTFLPQGSPWAPYAVIAEKPL